MIQIFRIIKFLKTEYNLKKYIDKNNILEMKYESKYDGLVRKNLNINNLRLIEIQNILIHSFLGHYKNEFFKLLKEIYKRLLNRFLFKRPDFSENRIFLQGKILQEKNKEKNKIDNLKDVEFFGFSQFGDDGIISWLVNQIPNIKKICRNWYPRFWTQNTRFLLKSENWSGILVDSSEKDIRKIKQQRFIGNN